MFERKHEQCICNCKNIQKSALERHEKSNDHVTSMKKAERKRKMPSLIDIDEPGSSGGDTSPISTNDSIVFKTVYYAAKEELPNDKINSLIELQRCNGLDISYRNLSWDTITDMQQTISDDLQRNQINKMKSSPAFSIMLDESQDLGVQKKLAICVRYTTPEGEAATEFLGNIRVENGKAHTIVNTVYDYLTDLGLNMEKIVCLASDGAATMMGQKTGVGVQLVTKYCPFMIHTHCIAHRLALAISDVMKSGDLKELQTFRSRFNTLFWFFNASAVRSTKLEKVHWMTHV